MRSLFFFLFLLSLAPALILSQTVAELKFANYPNTEPEWHGWGGNDWNWRAYSKPSVDLNVRSFTGTEKTIQPVCELRIGSVFGNPVTDGGRMMFFTTMNGSAIAMDRFNCEKIWSFDVGAWIKTKLPGNVPGIPRSLVSGPGLTVDNLLRGYITARVSPVVDATGVYIATQAGSFVLKLDLLTGVVLWSERASLNPYGIITSSATLYKEKVCWGTSSLEEAATLNATVNPTTGAVIPGLYPEYVQTFIGSFNCYHTQTGRLLWKTDILPKNSGYLGGAVWSSMAPIDTKRGHIYISTGNAYEIPERVQECIEAIYGNSSTSMSNSQHLTSACREPHDNTEAILAIDLDTGIVKKRFTRSPAEAWEYNCGANAFQFSRPRVVGVCSDTPGEDADFGQSPVFIPALVSGLNHDMLAVGQKSGVMFGINVDDFSMDWSVITGPAGTTGGLQFGSATDGKSIYFVSANSRGVAYNLTAPAFSHGSINPGINANSSKYHGNVGKMSALDGTMIWQMPLDCQLGNAPTYSNGLLFIGCGTYLRNNGPAIQITTFDAASAYILNAATGEILWSKFDMPGFTTNGATVIDNMIYWPSGYRATTRSGTGVTIPASSGGVLVYTMY